MQTFTPNPEHYTLEPVPHPGCSQCALHVPFEGCGSGPLGAWADKCLYPENIGKVWVLRPEFTNQ